MPRVAVLVDAGYLFAQGSAAIFGAKRSRSDLRLDQAEVIAQLIALAEAKSGTQLLRIYWYDAAPGFRGQSAEHGVLAHMDHVKLRLGFMNSMGQQKGVDSLIVTDLIELSRNKAISDALLLSGDEDVRIGVQIAQGFGIRVHLLGIVPIRGSQSLLLMQEADTTTEWGRTRVESFLSERTTPAEVASASRASASAVPSSLSSPGFDAVVMRVVEDLARTDILECMDFWSAGHRGIPGILDAKLLTGCRGVVDRDLTQEEKRAVRRALEAAIRSASAV